MARPVMSNGQIYPRKMSVRWDFVRQVLRYRQDERAAIARGFIKVRAFAELPWESPNVGWRIVETMTNRDGSALYAKVERHG